MPPHHLLPLATARASDSALAVYYARIVSATIVLYCIVVNGIAVTFRVSRRRREMYSAHGRLCVCLSLAAFSHYCTDRDVTWGNGMGAL